MSAPVHASAVAFGKRGVLILGPSGSGKSALALDLIAMGGALVADDRVILTTREDVLLAAPPPALEGRIEARGIGIIRTDWVAPIPLILAADLGQTATKRLPDPKTWRFQTCNLPLIAIGGLAHAAPALRAILLGGLDAPDGAPVLHD